MRVEMEQHPYIDRHWVRVVLSERNLRALLAKLTIEGSACTIYKDGVLVTSERDADHYAPDQTPGVMHPLTETKMKEVNSGADECNWGLYQAADGSGQTHPDGFLSNVDPGDECDRCGGGGSNG
jgi:hypothetical protein